MLMDPTLQRVIRVAGRAADYTKQIAPDCAVAVVVTVPLLDEDSYKIGMGMDTRGFTEEHEAGAALAIALDGLLKRRGESLMIIPVPGRG
jgi:hypothetical protein